MSSRVDGSAAELVQGPCEVDGTTFACSGVKLLGESGTLEHIRVAVVTDAVAERLVGASKFPPNSTLANAETQVYKG
jgi:hypothetical protein